MPPKRYPVKLKVNNKFLSTLPVFEPPVPKSRVKRLIDKKLPNTTSVGSSKTSSPQPENRINSGLKESSTSGLTMNSSGLNPLDKSGKPANKWHKRPVQFKTFTGYKIKYSNWRQKKVKEVKDIKEIKEGVTA